MVLERDAAEPGETAEHAWGTWSRPGVNQFRQDPGLIWPNVGAECVQISVEW